MSPPPEMSPAGHLLSMGGARAWQGENGQGGAGTGRARVGSARACKARAGRARARRKLSPHPCPALPTLMLALSRPFFQGVAVFALSRPFLPFLAQK